MILDIYGARHERLRRPPARHALQHGVGGAEVGMGGEKIDPCASYHVIVLFHARYISRRVARALCARPFMPLTTLITHNTLALGYEA